ncbi:MAG: hypothetical protein HY706_06070 [Candidatus Hydrogenedentes bacterium]|nr:hypothetical protein [Candidatus Hydrogenedentota bacterium]
MTQGTYDELTDFPATASYGVPLGGVGAGSIEMGRDGCFRNVTINNNRAERTRIGWAGGSFLAVRVAQKGKVLSRILQTETLLPFAEAGIVPTYSTVEQLSWRGLYPCSHYRLNDPKFPADVNWTAMSPIVPYDAEASTLPILFITVYVQNPSASDMDVAVTLNWENLCGCYASYFPERRGPIRPVVLKEEDTELEIAKKIGKHEELLREERPARPAGLEFGFREGFRTNAEGNYCLVAKQQQDVDISLLGWDERSPGELEVFWNQFHYEGHLGNKISRSERSHSGAVCNSFSLPANRGRSVVFIFTWYCPRFEVEGVDMGNGYTNAFHDAVEVASRGLKYYRYYFSTVEDWQKRILSSTLPRWLSRMLVNNNYVFSTNTLFTRDGRFAMFETPSDPVVGSLDRRFHYSLGSLLFFPEFEHRELALFAKLEYPQQPGRLYRHLGNMCLHRPNMGPTEDELLDIAPKFVLMAYRNYFMTSRLPPLELLYPKLKLAMEYVLSKDQDQDGLPEQSSLSTTFDTWAVYGVNSYTAGLWIAAIRAYSKLARRLGHGQEARKYEDLLPRAIESFEKRLWSEEHGYYRLFHETKPNPDGSRGSGDGCHSGQLAGQWYANFLSLGNLFPRERVDRALDAMQRLNEKITGIANGAMPDESPWENPASVPVPPNADWGWPSFSATHYASLLMYQGRTDRGLYAIQKMYKNVHAKAGLIFNQPLMWDLDRNLPCGWGQERHAGSLAIWHVLYALQGFYLNLPEQTLWVCPNLPKGVYSLSTPLFTPACFGWLRFREQPSRVYHQQLRISFDSPIQVKTLVLRAPEHIENVAVKCISQAGEEKIEHYMGSDGRRRLIEIIPEKPIMIGSALDVSVTEIPTQNGS